MQAVMLRATAERGEAKALHLSPRQGVAAGAALCGQNGAISKWTPGRGPGGKPNDERLVHTEKNCPEAPSW